MQDYPGRTKLWHVGVPPSGPMDALAFRLANALVGNEESAAGLEITLSGAPTACALLRTPASSACACHYMSSSGDPRPDLEPSPMKCM